jgi:hypothetical protein
MPGAVGGDAWRLLRSVATGVVSLRAAKPSLRKEQSNTGGVIRASMVRGRRRQLESAVQKDLVVAPEGEHHGYAPRCGSLNMSQRTKSPWQEVQEAHDALTN